MIGERRSILAILGGYGMRKQISALMKNVRLHYERMRDPVARDNFRKRQKELRDLGVYDNRRE